MPVDFSALNSEISKIRPTRPVGRVREIRDGLVRVMGLNEHARIGDHLTLMRRTGDALAGEVIAIDENSVGMLPDTAPDGVAIGDKATLEQGPGFAPAASWVGRVVDPFGRPLDGNPLMPGQSETNIFNPPPAAAERQALGDRIETGSSVMNTLLPVVKGQRIGLFAGSGVGKSRLLANLARNMQADIVVLALVGERGREVNEFVARTLGPEGMRRTVVVAATSDQSALTRRRCAWSATTVAEFFRDQGNHVLLLTDSVTRFAEAHREIAAASGEAPALRGFPPSVTPMITGLCERSGPGGPGQGTITAIYTVLVAGSDMDEPVADILRGVLDGHIVLSRDIAERGRFPAIDVGRSVSRCLPDAATEAENTVIAETRRLLGAYEQSETMIRAGLYAAGADPVVDAAVRVWPMLDEFFARAEPGGISDSFKRLELILRRAQGAADRSPA